MGVGWGRGGVCVVETLIEAHPDAGLTCTLPHIVKLIKHDQHESESCCLTVKANVLNGSVDLTLGTISTAH